MYPSKLIVKILPKIDNRMTCLKRAYKFVMSELKQFPSISPEIILLDYLFNPENRIPKHLAVYIIILLLDLQEDFRFHIKRGFLRYLLR